MSLGRISRLLYSLDGGVTWVTLDPGLPPSLGRGTAVYLMPEWENLSEDALWGRWEVDGIAPDGTFFRLLAVDPQPQEVAPGETGAVRFGPLGLDQVGNYNLDVLLSIHRTEEAPVAEFQGALYTPAIISYISPASVINTVMPMVGLVMVLGMMVSLLPGLLGGER